MVFLVLQKDLNLNRTLIFSYTLILHGAYFVESMFVKVE